MRAFQTAAHTFLLFPFIPDCIIVSIFVRAESCRYRTSLSLPKTSPREFDKTGDVRCAFWFAKHCGWRGRVGLRTHWGEEDLGKDLGDVRGS
jgi:hypothetical protein